MSAVILFLHIYRAVLIWDAELTQLFVLRLGAHGLLHVESHLEPESCHHLPKQNQVQET